MSTITTSRPATSFGALLGAYAVADRPNSVVLQWRAGDIRFVDFEDEDGTLVAVGPDGTALLGVGVPAHDLLMHYRAGHRTGTDGLGLGGSCSLCHGGDGLSAFTRPGYRPPVPAPGPEEDDEP